MFVRAVLAFLALPGVVALAVPWLLARATRARFDLTLGGAVALGLGLALLLWCVVVFYRVGEGSLAPWSPPRHLVVVGPYRWSRNPMYVAVLLLLLGWAVLFASAALAWYASAVALAFHLRVVWGEEPWLARQHGAAWTVYAANVPRWWPRPMARRGSR